MNEKSLEVLEQYELNIYRINRGRGGMIISTGDGTKLLLECQKSDKYYEREDTITGLLVGQGIKNTDTYMRNNNGEMFVNDSEGRRYVLKNWYDGRECNVSDAHDISTAVNSLARLHIALNQVSKNHKDKLSFNYNTQDIKTVYTRHARELKMAFNYLKNKNNKSEFEQLAYKNIQSFYDEAMEAVSLFGRDNIMERIKQISELGQISHGSFNYHNIIMLKESCAITNFDKYKNECQISDLYQFMRKILEKYDWDIQTAYKMMEEYDKIKPVSDTERALLAALFAFPEKFWKVMNYYFNSNKAWIPPKTKEKLEKVVQQNEKRQKFLETLL